MLFRKKIEKSCSYCGFGAVLEGGQILCTKRGMVPADGKCRKFRYDPCKRIPPKPKAPDFQRYDQEDFSL
ncbi:MAG: hypothetical protein LUJ09_01845 [Firmicutes bacterium]|nr:hypothetical protein [Bacillota bacterium]